MTTESARGRWPFHPRNDPRLGAGPKEQKRLLLYVDDDEGNREVLKLRLRARFDVLLASNDREAVAALATYGDKLQAVLLDVELRGSKLDGVGLSRLIRGTLPAAETPAYVRSLLLPEVTAPIIFVTAYGGRYTEQALTAAGGSLVVPKPVNFVALCATLTRYARRQADRTLRPRVATE